jgi:hypothetical protein
MLATAGAVVGLLVGARRHTGAVARGYRWLGAAAVFWFAGLIISQVLAGSGPSGEPLSLADVAPLLGLATAACGVMVLAEDEKRNDTGSVLPGLADGYVMAVALLVIGWVVAFGSEFHHLNERPGTFLEDLLHPLADLAVLGALLPVLTVAWRRVAVPYVGLMALTFADSLGVGAKISSNHQGILEQLAMIAAACLFGLAPWVGLIAARLDLASWVGQRQTKSADGGASSLLGVRRSPVTSAGAATIIAAFTVVIAALVVIINGRARFRARAGHRRRCGRPRRRGSHPDAGAGERRRDADVARGKQQPARSRGPDRRHGADLRPGRDHQLREQARLRVQLPDGGADRQVAERLRAPRGHRRRAGGRRHRDRPA